MLDPQEFIAYLDKGIIPDWPPITTAEDHWKARSEATARGMWALVYKAWVKELAH